ncbi:nitroreductase/quinone reductase family protein [Myceligenerans pegani]|uniref:Nitroreductase family deazaflavin-dependent oxidoreductase n=1 Tax=Myceligenerans pegani TaxID=2776917 RepID=A0ABR9MUK6_9MICO|nr:nitroreductase/quinone reductase family protein [Myceligenerans sp. TRM 65318]MBE1874736.1 nitroreductase family deazaflavin-dependent oxidoreductase [Myceligenerans sp. TRM 65318]MBE3017007.1 nitroreductase family deazaflavin-dependent oxidoreductase [Myceligenerans sp. TRM 65318]
MTSTDSKTPWLPPRWFIRTAWRVHRFLYRVGGKRFLREAEPGKGGMLRLIVTGRRTGTERAVILSYVRDGDRLVTLAMNGWGDTPPLWWLNLQANPEATARTVDGTFRVRAREAVGTERDELWRKLNSAEGWGDIEAFAARRRVQTPVVVLDLVGEA